MYSIYGMLSSKCFWTDQMTYIAGCMAALDAEHYLQEMGAQVEKTDWLSLLDELCLFEDPIIGIKVKSLKWGLLLQQEDELGVFAFSTL